MLSIVSDFSQPLPDLPPLLPAAVKRMRVSGSWVAVGEGSTPNAPVELAEITG